MEDFDFENAGRVKVITLTGEFGAEKRQNFDKLVKRLVEAGHRQFLLVLKGVEFIDSTAIGGILALRTHLLEIEGTVELAVIQSPFVDRVFGILGMHHLFNIHPCREDALRGMGAY